MTTVESMNTPFGVVESDNIFKYGLEAAMWFIQIKRATALEEELKTSMTAAEDRTKKNDALNRILQLVNKVSNNLGSDAKQDKEIGQQNAAILAQIKDIAKEAGIDPGLLVDPTLDEQIAKKQQEQKQLDIEATTLEKKFSYSSRTNTGSGGKTKVSYERVKNETDAEKKAFNEYSGKAKNKREDYFNNGHEVMDLQKKKSEGFSEKTTKADVETAIGIIKGKMETNNSNSQLEMIRLNALNSKRNEAFEMLSSFVKKLMDSRSSLINAWR